MAPATACWKPKQPHLSKATCDAAHKSVRRSARLVHVFDIGLEDKQVGLAVAVHFQAALVIPLNHAFQGLTVFEYEDHARLRLHLLHVVEILGVGLVGWSNLL